MTGLLNRTGFNSQLEENLEGNKQKNCVGILLDVDNFKFINDVFGHTTGDQVLLQLAQSLVQTFPDNSIIARNGGDEFCIILKDCNAEEAASQIEAFSNASRSFSAKGIEHNYSISLGYAEYPANAEKVSDILRYADIALYEVKLQGKHGAPGLPAGFPQFQTDAAWFFVIGYFRQSAGCLFHLPGRQGG